MNRSMVLFGNALIFLVVTGLVLATIEFELASQQAMRQADRAAAASRPELVDIIRDRWDVFPIRDCDR